LLSEKNSNPKNCKHGQKEPKMAAFWPWRAEFCKNKKKALEILLPLPQRGCIPNFRNLEKMLDK
jgi:hypothetical protein